MQRYRLEVGHSHQVKPDNIVGAIANEANMDSQFIGRINIFDDHSLVDLPEGMPKDIFNTLKKVWVSGQQLNISVLSDSSKTKGSGKRTKNREKPKSRDRKAKPKKRKKKIVKK